MAKDQRSTAEIRAAHREACADMVLEATGRTIEDWVGERRNIEAEAIAAHVRRGDGGATYRAMSDVELVRDGVVWAEGVAWRGYGREAVLTAVADISGGRRGTRWDVIESCHREAAILSIAAGAWPEQLDHEQWHDIGAVIRATAEAIRQRRARQG